MIGQSHPRVAVLGMTESGRGWATLLLGAGWPVTIYDPDAALLHGGEEEIATRKRLSLGTGVPAVREDTEQPQGQPRLGRSLLDTVTNADWIIDSTSGDLLHRQRLLEQVERAARLAAILTCSAAGLSPKELCARLRRPTRLVVAHALSPVEHIPAVEVVPGPMTDPAVLDELRRWLRLLGRIPVVLRKEVPGNATGRIAAAMWRECIRLVLDGVLEVRDVDALISSGLAARWSAAGPFQTAYLEAGERQTAQLSAMLRAVEGGWDGDGGFHLSPADHQHLIRLIERAYDGEGDVLKGARDERLAELRRVVGY
ncbi:MAG TPA: 3-hydroxyacyl-CoA dehydrogenase NAD-binding domain-containing protein [Gemmatimonadales bacterium]|nr:3-hydroxyacyl-CoA dehydrogenase NAD-binding domain-containing protein [Gemmatimonadales bacterium]